MRKNIYNGYEEHKHFGRLADYIEIDSTYQNYKKGIKPKTETEQFAILHSGDIEWALNEIERLNNIINKLEQDAKNIINAYGKGKYQNNYELGLLEYAETDLNIIQELKEGK